MALVGVLSTQLLYSRFVQGFRVAALTQKDPVKTVDRATGNGRSDVP